MIGALFTSDPLGFLAATVGPVVAGVVASVVLFTGPDAVGREDDEDAS